MELERQRTLTNREAAAVAAVTVHYTEHRHAPSCKELGRRLGVRTSQVDRLVKAAASLGSLIVVRRKGERTQIRLANPLAEFPTLTLAAELDARAAIGEMVPRPGNDRETNRDRLAA